LANADICIQPSVNQRLDILDSVVRFAHALGADRPLVALLAATESVAETMPETFEAARRSFFITRRSPTGNSTISPKAKT